MPNAGSSLKPTGPNAQPQPGALFSGMAQAPVSNGLPLHATRKGYVASYCSRLPASGANPLAGLALASTGLVQTAGEAGHHSFVFPASWAKVWQLKARAQPSFGGRVATLSESTAYVDLSRLLYGLSEYSATSGLLAWKQNKLISPKSNLLGTERTLLAAALFRESSLQAVASLVSTSTTRVIRAGYTAIQPGVANMRRLRVTQGIYLPVDLPIHGIFGSKDVIHS